jgi:hypothetical protein
MKIADPSDKNIPFFIGICVAVFSYYYFFFSGRKILAEFSSTQSFHKWMFMDYFEGGIEVLELFYGNFFNYMDFLLSLSKVVHLNEIMKVFNSFVFKLMPN